METKKQRPYWLDGTENCELCSHPYVHQAERRCAACDRAVCEHCFVRADTGEILCEECRDQAEEEG